MAIHYVKRNGDPVPDNVTVRCLSRKVLLSVEIQALGPVSPSVVMRLLKKQYDCRSVEIETEIVTCKVRN